MPCTIGSSPARASRAYRLTNGEWSTRGGKKRARGDLMPRALAEWRYKEKLRAGPEIRGGGRGPDQMRAMRIRGSLRAETRSVVARSFNQKSQVG
jgi:hypothetical protein